MRHNITAKEKQHTSTKKIYNNQYTTNYKQREPQNKSEVGGNKLETGGARNTSEKEQVIRTNKAPNKNIKRNKKLRNQRVKRKQKKQNNTHTNTKNKDKIIQQD